MKTTLIIFGFSVLFMCGNVYASQQASWYGAEACRYNKDKRCPTASGDSLYVLLEKERNGGEHFSASWFYKLGTVIEVCREDDRSRCVKTRVLDRGPNKRLTNRVVDLSESAFAELASPRQGLVNVTVKEIK